MTGEIFLYVIWCVEKYRIIGIGIDVNKIR